MYQTRPIVGRWFKEIQQGQIFEVVAIDEQERTIETQMIDGELAEYDMESWCLLELEQVHEPENWCSAYELNQEDRADPDAPFHPIDWAHPLNAIEPDTVYGLLDEY